MSAGITPSAVSTPVTLEFDCSIPVTSVLPMYFTPAASVRLISNCTARAARARPSVGTWRPPRMSSVIDQRVELLAFLAGEDLAVDAP